MNDPQLISPRFMVSFSSGITSWAAAKRTADQYGTQDMVLVFADTKIEDEDNYRFLRDSAANIGAPLEVVADGRTPWEVMKDERFIGNSQIDPCSKILKRELLKKWRTEHCDSEQTVTIIGLNWDEVNRIEKVKALSSPWVVEAPLASPPYLSKGMCLDWARKEGLEPPRLYNLGFSHANCGGFCIKGGQGHFARLYRFLPERYLEHEQEEQNMMAFLGTDNTILTEQVGGVEKKLSLKDLRERIENNEQIDLFEIGGYGCGV